MSLEQNNSQWSTKGRLPVRKSTAEFCGGVVVKGLMPSDGPKLFHRNTYVFTLYGNFLETIQEKLKWV